MWVFDDEARGLLQEPFVGGADTLIDRAVAEFGNPEEGFVMVFSAGEFPGTTLSMTWVRAGMGGNYYYCPQLETEGWLCPALLKYFSAPPAALYVKAEPLGS